MKQHWKRVPGKLVDLPPRELARRQLALAMLALAALPLMLLEGALEPESRAGITTSAQTTPPPLVAHPSRIECSPALHGTILRTRFELENPGANPVTVTTMTPDCSCVRVLADQLTIPARSRAPVEVEIDTARLTPGARTQKHIAVRAGGSPQASAVVEIVFDLAPVLDIGPVPLSVSVLPGPAPVLQLMDLQAIVENALPLQAVRTQHGRLQVELAPPSEDRTRQQLRVTIPPHREVATFPEVLVLELAPRDGRPWRLEFPIQVIYRDRIGHEPMALRYRRPGTDGLVHNPPVPVTQVIQVRQLEPGPPFRVTEVTLENAPPGVFETALRTLEEGRSYEIDVTIIRAHRAHRWAGRLLIRTDDPLNPLRSVPVTAEFPGAPPPRSP